MSTRQANITSDFLRGSWSNLVLSDNFETHPARRSTIPVGCGSASSADTDTAERSVTVALTVSFRNDRFDPDSSESFMLIGEVELTESFLVEVAAAAAAPPVAIVEEEDG